jgi:hypothetical protein
MLQEGILWRYLQQIRHSSRVLVFVRKCATPFVVHFHIDRPVQAVRGVICISGVFDLMRLSGISWQVRFSHSIDA